MYVNIYGFGSKKALITLTAGMIDGIGLQNLTVRALSGGKNVYGTSDVRR
jgi:hypothetical protein